MSSHFLDSLISDSAKMLRLLRLLVAASMLVPLLLFTGIAWREHDEAENKAEQTIQRTVLILHEHVQKVFDSIEQVLDRVDERTHGMNWDEVGRAETLHTYLKTLEQELPQLGAVAMVDPTGVVRASSLTFPMVPVNVADMEFFRRHVDSDIGIHVAESIVGRFTHLRQFNVSRRRTGPGGPDGQFNGVLSVAIPRDYFEDFYRRVTSDSGQIITILREDGAVLTRFPALAGDRPVRLTPDTGFMRVIASGQRDGVFRARSISDGVDRIYGFAQIAPYPIYVTYGVAQSEVTADWLHNTAMYAAFALPATMAMIGISWLALRRARREAEALNRWAAEVRTREALEAALRQSQKLEALGQLTGGVAHDFNNLLTAALTNLHLMDRTLPEGSRRYMDGTRTALDRAKKLTGQLLAFSRQEAVNPVVVDLGSSLRQMADLLERSIRADIALEWDLAPEPLAVEVDPVQLELAILNLVINARDAMPDGGRIRLSARCGAAVPEDPQEPAVAPPVVLEVADTGTGMPPEVRARAFEPFFTTKSHGRGTGLGLSMVYGFARQAGGSAQIESTPGEGTLIRLILPATSRRPAAEPAPEASEQGAGRERLRVLVVEDNALVLMATVEGLTEEGFDVLTADHGAAALEVLEGEPGIDVVVSDVVMPYGVSGIDLARRVHERWPQVRVLLTSGYSPESLAGMGADTAVLPKPFTPDQLAARVRGLIRPMAAT